MNDEAAMPVPQVFGETRWQDGGTGTGEHCAIRRQAIERGENCLLDVEALECAFLHVISVGKRGGQGLLDAQAGQQSLRAGAVEQIVRGQIRRHRCGEIDRALRGLRVLVPQRNVMSGACERDRPCSADESAANDRDARAIKTAPAFTALREEVRAVVHQFEPQRSAA